MIVDRPDMGISRHPELSSETPLVALGGNGLVGSRIIELDSGIVVPDNRIDITKRDEVLHGLEPYAGGTVVNFAAYTNVGEAEKLKSLDDAPWQVNVLGAYIVAEACAKHGIHLVHVSTDFVFSGDKEDTDPYDEDAPIVETPDGITWYGWTKAVAEREVQNSLSNGDLSILRIAYPYRAHFDGKGDFARDIQSMDAKGTLYPMYTDQYLTPTFIDDVQAAIRMIQDKRVTGILHVASPEICSPHQFASYLLGHDVEEGHFPDTNPRPKHGGLAVTKTQEVLELEFMTWQQGVDAMLEQQSS